MRVLELFSGYGSQALALENLGIEFTSDISEIDMAAKSLPNEVDFERLGAPIRGFVGSFEGFVDNALVRATDLREKQRIAAGKSYQMSAGDPLRDMALNWEIPTEEEQAEAQKLVNTAQEIRKANKDWWENTKQAIKPEEEMDELDKFNEQLGAGVGSLSASMGSMVLFKNPTLQAILKDISMRLILIYQMESIV